MLLPQWGGSDSGAGAQSAVRLSSPAARQGQDTPRSGDKLLAPTAPNTERPGEKPAGPPPSPREKKMKNKRKYFS